MAPYRSLKRANEEVARLRRMLHDCGINWRTGKFTPGFIEFASRDYEERRKKELSALVEKIKSERRDLEGVIHYDGNSAGDNPS